MSPVETIAARRAELVARAQSERERVAHDLVPLAGALRMADKGWAVASWLRERPMIVAAASAALAVAAGRRPRRMMQWARLGMSAWQAWRWMSRAAAARNES